MFTRFPLLKPLSTFKKGTLSLVLFYVCLVFTYPVRAQPSTTVEPDHGTMTQSRGRQDDWVSFPYTLQIRPYAGLLTEPIPLLEDPNAIKGGKYKRLYITGASIDISVFQIRRFIWKHFHCYPKLGLVLNYGRLQNEGSLAGGGIYLEPQHDHLAKWEIVPRLSLGIAYADIPAIHFDPKDEQAMEKKDNYADFFYLRGLQLDLALALACNIRLTPYWQLFPSVGWNLIAPLAKLDYDVLFKQDDYSLNFVTASLGLGYTPTPSLICYPAVKINKKNRVDIGWLSSFRKYEPLKVASQTNQQSDDKYYYAGGLHGQFSLGLSNSHAVTLATEWVYDGAAKKVLKGSLFPSPLQIALLGGHEFRWGRLLSAQQVGCYVLHNEFTLRKRIDKLFFAKMGLSFRLVEAVYMGGSMKIFMDLKEKKLATDFVSFCIGYSF